MLAYIALIHKDPASDYGVSFPDLPGVVTAGRTLDEARAFAAEALALHIEGLLEDGEPLPAPSSLEMVMADKTRRRAVAVLVEAPEGPERVVRVNITVPERVLAEMDRTAEEEGMTRSGLLVRSFLSGTYAKSTSRQTLGRSARSDEFLAPPPKRASRPQARKKRRA